ncbi:uncharacterized protein MONOS_6053 [Monocercomonoides exilis]|uniref:uncharacterized protein n=1 Tax=Monocercomonoides exilis TaxID=2049356 RepID=UPI00355A30D0|nr:hypothetical protein MONOS_6053 [Monocercomonoides exilis]|eukprot:MONOS_6053.1-p1 / transcript=MONOS_6053.1 / gene=MONOS_6053 / organism=Monocercomonoides_exilis_PA203 / gene_product=unspecified product / transcript_product=unspecified product / location=Mono_scaffold00185:85430-86056(+) / protein_length=209 / sequence_SO=supercontig / SO=protein_coding / is_pseudo=false
MKIEESVMSEKRKVFNLWLMIEKCLYYPIQPTSCPCNQKEAVKMDIEDGMLHEGVRTLLELAQDGCARLRCVLSSLKSETINTLGDELLAASWSIPTCPTSSWPIDMLNGVAAGEESALVPITLTVFPFPKTEIFFSPTMIDSTSFPCLPSSNVIVELSPNMLDSTAFPTVLQGVASLIPHRSLASSPPTPTNRSFILSFSQSFFSLC